jgi:putative heme degradation protein
MNDTTALRQQLTAAPDRVLARLTAMGKVMVVAQDGGVTHERIGVVEKVRKDDGRLMFSGAAHDCTIDMTHVASAVADRSGRMKDKVLPKLEFLSVDGSLVFSVVGLDGIDKFDHALARFVGVAVEPKAKAQGAPATLPDDDPGLQPLVAASKAGEEIAIEMEKPGVVQRWRGFVPTINPVMGFINIIAPDFHLHLRGGAVARWNRHDVDAGGDVRLTALDSDGKPIGLALQGPRDAFEPT